MRQLFLLPLCRAECAGGGTARCRREAEGRGQLPAAVGLAEVSDATLREMVQSKPLSMDEFLNITGVGEKKAARYGMAFLRAIEDMVGSRE